ncbi:MAG TPA: bifunctional 23S rRNA (guanine(2069)-N(7))-methyltransferase RlmK/23S rRNA (guanine(2445)-N(2))-methyltransferase RlmL [Steroidobacteraceae bacterium]|nr:bifunctional 23S rRNA (guanine(2069)-N(7))-methyltransferase RlmK/23S rRNA (guanine(2445)-N(2))-methyltransferase RlmL [Steroidobacteraceae bacterium]
MSPDALAFTASCPRGFADLLAAELKTFGATEVRERATGVAFRGALAVGYRACLGSRIANRIFLELARFEAADAEALYRGVRALEWTRHIGPGATIACDFSGRHPTITHTQFGALKIKDAVCDELRARTGERPDVARERPGVRVHAHAAGVHITLAIDLAGESLHRRGYRAGAGEAPLKENVAAGVLLRARWPELAAGGAEFLDPLCGSGTLVIEAALIAADLAPGRLREYFGFLGWRGHDRELWKAVQAEATARAAARAVELARSSLVIRGEDRDPRLVALAQGNAERAGIAGEVAIAVGLLGDARPRVAGSRGLLCTNPPYGVRLEDRAAARAVHRELGVVLREHFHGWDAAVLTGAPDLGIELGLRAHRTHAVWNGAIECRLLRLEVSPESVREPGRLGRGEQNLSDTPGARMFANRIAKNLKRLGAWAEASGISCYRLYDADMPEYAFAIDRYRTLDPPLVWLYVQEYAAPAEIEREAASRRRAEALGALPLASGVAAEQVRLRTRRRVHRGEQYVKLAERGRFYVVEEGGLKFYVNFDDYLDTGVFLDQRATRARLRTAARGARFLNLFAYTGTATAYAAAAGALASTSVDLSRTYLEWARRNLALNGLDGPRHELVQADCREWLAAASGPFDLIFLDPPTFSNSKRMRGVLDIARDHPELIDACARLLAPGGLILFSTNAQRFRLEPGLGARYAIRDVSRETLPRDFERNPRIHRCFELRLATGLGTSSGRQGFPSRASI